MSALWTPKSKRLAAIAKKRWRSSDGRFGKQRRADRPVRRDSFDLIETATESEQDDDLGKLFDSDLDLATQTIRTSRVTNRDYFVCSENKMSMSTVSVIHKWGHDIEGGNEECPMCDDVRCREAGYMPLDLMDLATRLAVSEDNGWMRSAVASRHLRQPRQSNKSENSQ